MVRRRCYSYKHPIFIIVADTHNLSTIFTAFIPKSNTRILVKVYTCRKSKSIKNSRKYRNVHTSVYFCINYIERNVFVLGDIFQLTTLHIMHCKKAHFHDHRKKNLIVASTPLTGMFLVSSNKSKKARVRDLLSNLPLCVCS